MNKKVPKQNKKVTKNKKVPSIVPRCLYPSASRKHPHSQSHILFHCEAVNDLRNECDIEDNKSLAEFFRKAVARNMELEDEIENT